MKLIEISMEGHDLTMENYTPQVGGLLKETGLQ